VHLDSGYLERPGPGIVNTCPEAAAYLSVIPAVAFALGRYGSSALHEAAAE